MLSWLGFGSEPALGQRTPSEIVGYLVLVVIIPFSAIEAANLLNFSIVADLLAQFISFVSQVALAVVVFGPGGPAGNYHLCRSPGSTTDRHC